MGLSWLHCGMNSQRVRVQRVCSARPASHAHPAIPTCNSLSCSGTVYRALYLDEIVAAKEIDIGRSLSMQEAFVNVSPPSPLTNPSFCGVC